MTFTVRVQKINGEIREFPLQASDLEDAKKEAADLIHPGMIILQVRPTNSEPKEFKVLH
jgi:hypothetical protein